MAQDTNRLRNEIDHQRAAISETVDQIENRVSPSRVIARRQDRIQSRLNRWKESVFGSDPSDNERAGAERARSAVINSPSAAPGYGYRSAAMNPPPTVDDGGVTDDKTRKSSMNSQSASPGSKGTESESTLESARDTASEKLHEAPGMVREQTSGNPLAAGAVALAAGWLVGSLIPSTSRERQLTRAIEPQLAEVASTVRTEGQEAAEDLRGDARQAADKIKETGQEAARDAKSEVRQRTGR